MMLGAYSFSVFRMCVRGYVHTNVRPSVRMCVRTYVCTPVKAFVPGRILQFYSQVPHSGASLYCGHISSYSYFFIKDFYGTHLNCLIL